LVHLAIADVVNDAHENEFWMSTYKLAEKARVSRSTVTSTLSDMCAIGLLVCIAHGGESRLPSRYVFQMTSAPDGLVASGSSDVRSSTSAIRADSLARSARAIPKEINQETKEKQNLRENGKKYADVAVPPWTKLGLTWQQWRTLEKQNAENA